MKSASGNKISAESLSDFNKQKTLELTKIKQDEKSATTFNSLKNEDLRIALVFNKPVLILDYVHLLNK